ncbi:ABC transporter permease subunit [Planctomycetota bacterium]
MTQDDTSRKSRGRRRRQTTSLAARGEPVLWLTGGSLISCLIMILGLLALILYQGLSTFWPRPLVRFTTHDGRTLMGEVTRRDQIEITAASMEAVPAILRESLAAYLAAGKQISERHLIRTGNFDLTGTHFTWVSDYEVQDQNQPAWGTLVERQEWGRFYGIPVARLFDGQRQDDSPAALWQWYAEHHDTVRQRWHQIRSLEDHDIGRVNAQLEQARLKLRRFELEAGGDSSTYQVALKTYQEAEGRATMAFTRIRTEIAELRHENERYQLVFATADGQEKTLALADIVRAFQPNRLGLGGKASVYLGRWGEFLKDDPREANSEGGVFPAIFGTVLMTLLMSVAVVPFGVLAALYLREYAQAGPVISAVRIAINNLAGVPSIVFGVFGLGFFCYGIGSFIDGGPETAWPRSLWWGGIAALVACVVVAVLLGFLIPSSPKRQGTIGIRWLKRAILLLWITSSILVILMVARNPYFEGFFTANLPNPTFGKGALLWASITLALLTLPVVIVATEEALSAVPNSMREGSYACGSSKWQTIKRIVLPRAMPGIMTGTILAMARGAGEVAPLMLVGAVKLAPELPFAWSFPFGSNRSFMHLGFHIYDLGFQSQNSEAAKPMVFTTTLLLILIIATLNISAIALRTRLRKKFTGSKF